MRMAKVRGQFKYKLLREMSWMSLDAVQFALLL